MTDYRKMLKWFMLEQFDGEGGCWCPEVADREVYPEWLQSISDEEIKNVREVYSEVEKEFDLYMVEVRDRSSKDADAIDFIEFLIENNKQI